MKIINPINERKFPDASSALESRDGKAGQVSPTAGSGTGGYVPTKHGSAEATIAEATAQEPERTRGKLGPHLKLLFKLVEAGPRAKIKDFYLILKERGYHGSYDLVKKKIHFFRRELGKMASATFNSTEAPHAQVEMTKLSIKGGEKETKAYLFTMVLGNSGRFYAELMESYEMGGFLRCHQNAFAHFGGVPAGVFYDPEENPMRKLVGPHPFHLPVLDCGQHYGYAALPTPVFAPWMKGRLKRPGKVLKKLFFPGYEFVSWEKANADMLEWMALLSRQNLIADRKERGPKERLGVLPPVGFNFHGRRQFLRLRA
ncbi:MAG: hypothetical protein ABI036_08835 [Fibrobacteria bacterium]